jgi:uncharacterized protein
MARVAIEGAGLPTVVELSRQECLELVERCAFGRVVLSEACIPVAYPVNLTVVDGAVIFCTAAGPMLDAATRGDVVTIQADEIDRVYHTGWSVLITGVAQVIPASTELHRSLTPTWVPGHTQYLVRVPATSVSGRRLAWSSSRGGSSA